MTFGFIDTASINSAGGLLATGARTNWSEWDKQSLFDVTYLLLHSNIKVVPTMDKLHGATSYSARLVRRFPQLHYFKPATQQEAKAKTKAWLSRNVRTVATAWKESNKSKEFNLWANTHRQQAFVRHVERHGSLFEPMFLPYIARVVGCPVTELSEIDSRARDLRTVARWAKSDRDEIGLIEDAWMLGGMMRGKYHEYLARAEKLQLLQHQFRSGIGAKLKPGTPQAVTNSESYFINALIASALLERKSENRVSAWIDNVSKARQAILTPTIALPPCGVESDAEDFAFESAKKVGIPSRTAAFRRLLDWTFSVSLGTLVAYRVSPWIAPLGPLVSPSIQTAYHRLRGTTFGEDIERQVLFTKRRFQKLQKTVPGRIEHAPAMRL